MATVGTTTQPLADNFLVFYTHGHDENDLSRTAGKASQRKWGVWEENLSARWPRDSDDSESISSVNY